MGVWLPREWLGGWRIENKPERKDLPARGQYFYSVSFCIFCNWRGSGALIKPSSWVLCFPLGKRSRQALLEPSSGTSQGFAGLLPIIEMMVIKHLWEVHVSFLLQPSCLKGKLLHCQYWVQGCLKVLRLQFSRGHVLFDFGQLAVPCVCICSWK